MSQPIENAKKENDNTEPNEPPVGSWASVARMMSSTEDPHDPSGIDWDDWKDRQKDAGME